MTAQAGADDAAEQLRIAHVCEAAGKGIELEVLDALAWRRRLAKPLSKLSRDSTRRSRHFITRPAISRSNTPTEHLERHHEDDRFTRPCVARDRIERDTDVGYVEIRPYRLRGISTKSAKTRR